MVWSVISCKDAGRLHIVEGIMNSQKYVNVLWDHLLPQLWEWFPSGDAIFMQDGAPCHTAKHSMNFLQDNSEKFLSGQEKSWFKPYRNIMGYH